MASGPQRNGKVEGLWCNDVVAAAAVVAVYVDGSSLSTLQRKHDYLVSPRHGNVHLTAVPYAARKVMATGEPSGLCGVAGCIANAVGVGGSWQRYRDGQATGGLQLPVGVKRGSP